MTDVYASQIFSSKSIRCDTASDYEIHMLICERDVTEALWCLKTFYYFSGLRTKLFFHDDGSLKNGSIQTFKKHFVGCEVIRKIDADIFLKKSLGGYEFCSRYRLDSSDRMTITSMKLFDPIFYTQTHKTLILDADVLFFKKPTEIMECMRANRGCFMSDYHDAYSFPREILNRLLGVEMKESVNTGILYIPLDLRNELGFIETFLKYSGENGYPHSNWIEQTSWAALFSKHQELFTRLPASYQIADQRAIGSETVSCHLVHNGTRESVYQKSFEYLQAKNFLGTLNESIL